VVLRRNNYCLSNRTLANIKIESGTTCQQHHNDVLDTYTPSGGDADFFETGLLLAEGAPDTCFFAC
jgi:hypothetical protein